jgi:hypothetical protein
MEVTKKYKVKFTGKCAVCGGTILGWKGGNPTVSFEMAHYYQWRKRDASGAPITGKIMHVDPTCEEVAAGEIRPANMRADEHGAPTSIEPITHAPSIPVIHAPEPEPEVVPLVNPIVPVALEPQTTADPEPKIEIKVKAGSKKLVNPAASWEDMLTALINSGVRRIGLTGPAGTGKSTTAYKTLKALVGNRDVYRVTMTPRTTLEDLLGSFQLVKEDGVTVQKFVMGPVPLALINGCPLQFDEVTHVGGEVESLFYSVWDDQPQILLADGTYIDKVAPGFCCIGTTNDPPDQLAPPLLDRCEAFLMAVTPHPAALADCTPDEVAVCQNYYRALDTKQWQFSRSPSVRMVRSFSRFRKAGLISDELLAKAVFGVAGPEFLSAMSTASLTRRTEENAAVLRKKRGF